MKVNELIEPIRKLFNNALEVDGVEKVDISVSNMYLPNRHDLMIEMLLTKEGLTNFDNSEIHKEWKAEFGKYIVNKTIFDCD